MRRPIRTSAPSVKPVSLEEAKQHCRVDTNEDDTVITAFIEAAVTHLDGWSGVLGRCLINQGWRLSFTGWPACRSIRLPFPDVSDATVKYFDVDNVERTVDASLFERVEDERGAVIEFRDGFASPAVFTDRAAAVTVEFIAGYGPAGGDVPQAIRTAISLMIAHWYNHREVAVEGQSSEVPFGASLLIAPFRRIGI